MAGFMRNVKIGSRLPAVAILAGGLGTRMSPLTDRLPKAMLKVGGEPFIAHQLRLLALYGATDVVLCLGHLGEQVVEFVGDGRGFGVAVRYAFDGDRAMGTGGALRRALPMLGERFFVLYGDSYLDIDYRQVDEAFHRHRKPALMTIFRNEGKWGPGNVELRDDGSILYDKRRSGPAMSHIDFGLSVISRAALAGHPDHGPFDLADFYHDLSKRGELAAHESRFRFFEIGTPGALEETADYITLKSNHPRMVRA
jgi:NDP-sugar pyrophosphorylase family protein